MTRRGRDRGLEPGRRAHGVDPPRQASLATYDESVFVNCPFDAAYLPLLHAVVFTIHDCGFIARHALEDTGAAESRLDKIGRLIGESRWSIHDLSRVQLSRARRLPRFNMPFECGLAFGAVHYGVRRDRDILVLAGQAFEDKSSLSDLAGIDPAYHANDRGRAIAGVRTFLAAKAARCGVSAPRSHEAVHNRLDAFEAELPRSLRGTGTRVSTIRSLGYLNEWIVMAARWMRAHPQRVLSGRDAVARP